VQVYTLIQTTSRRRTKSKATIRLRNQSSVHGGTQRLNRARSTLT